MKEADPCPAERSSRPMMGPRGRRPRTRVQARRLGAAVVVMVWAVGVWGCGDEPGPGCPAWVEKEAVFDLMLEWYLWWQNLPLVDPGSFDTAERLLEAMRYPLDRWSYMVPTAVYNAYYSGAGYIGIGISMTYDGLGLLRISQVVSGSPADRSGLERGFVILGVNGRTVSDIEAASDWGIIFGEPKPGVEVTLEVRDRAGEERRVVVAKEVVVAPPVSLLALLEVGPEKVGYLVFDKFVDTSWEALRQAFSSLRQAAVADLILDLRYNGGGYVDVALYLASLLGGSHTAGKVFAEMRFNSKHPDLNQAYYFSPEADALGLQRVLVITTKDTASASELVINSLKPFIPVGLIGGATHGKPVGMYSFEFCEKTLAPVMFELFNAEGQGGYYQGLPPTCPAEDDLTRVLGDPEESSLREALFYRANGQCSAAAAAAPRSAGQAPPGGRRGSVLVGFDREVGGI